MKMKANTLSIQTEEIENLNLNKYNMSGSKRNVKLMSKTFMNLKTPDKIKGQNLDDQTKFKISTKKEKVLSLQININTPRYDDQGQPIFPDDDSDDFEDFHFGYFNMHLLDEEVLNQ